jgi:hypothetical protein
MQQQMSSHSCCGGHRTQHDVRLPYANKLSLPSRPGRLIQRRQRQEPPTHIASAFAGAAAPAISAGAGLSLSTGLLSFFSFAVGSVGLVLLLADQAKPQGPNPECSTCEGTGLVPCVCNRWSDGDRGCSICRGSGRMACPSCGGGGTAVPIVARVEATKGPSLMDRQ